MSATAGAREDPNTVVGDISYRTLFESTQTLVGLVVHEKQDIGKVLPLLEGYAYVQKAVRHVQDCVFTVPENLQQQQQNDDSEKKNEGITTTTNVRCILLDPKTSPNAKINDGADPFDLSSLPDDLIQKLKNGYIEKWRKDSSKSSVAHYPSPLSLVTKDIKLSYKNYTMGHLVSGVYKASTIEGASELVVPTGFEQVGHIAHLNLLSGQLPFKYKIGQIVIDTNPTVETVVNKVESLSSEFRELPLEVIGGDGTRLTAEVKQHGCIFQVPYDKCYWNSKLGEEHERLVQQMKKGDILFDVMAGVGPFAIPAAKRGVTVHGNDLNPASVAAMDENTKLNRVEKSITTYCMDGRDFISMVRDKHLLVPVDQRPAGRKHFVMNLPALAVTFCDAYAPGPGWEKGSALDQNFVVHCYMFSSSTVPKADAVEQVYANLFRKSFGGEGSKYDLTNPAVLANLGKRYVTIENSFIVRDVAPKKLMVLVSFSLTPAAFEPRHDDVDTTTEGAPETKRSRKE